MADYSVARAKTATLVAATEDTVTITGMYRKVQVINHDATATISATFQGAAATVDGDDTVPVLPGGVTTLYDTEGGDDTQVIVDDTDVVVSLISSGTPKYTVVTF